MANIIKSQSLISVTLPLIRILAGEGLSWSDREKLSAAVEACRRQWAEMEQERNLQNQQAQQGQAGQQVATGNLGELRQSLKQGY